MLLAKAQQNYAFVRLGGWVVHIFMGVSEATAAGSSVISQAFDLALCPPPGPLIFIHSFDLKLPNFLWQGCVRTYVVAL